MKLKSSFCLSVTIMLVLLLASCRAIKEKRQNKSLKEYTMEWEGYERQYLVHLPPKMKMKNPLPLLFNLHGGGGTASGTPGLTFGRFNELADRDGFIVVYPNAVEKNWNDGRELQNVTSQREDIDDVGFIVAIIEEMKKKYDIDEKRIFTAGMSNGGFMSSRLLCDRADLFRGGAILTATISEVYLPKCKPSKPVAVMIINGTDDSLVPYNGGQVGVLGKSRGEIISTDAYIKFWRDKNRCRGRKSIKNLPDNKDDGTTVTLETYDQCNRGGSLVLYTIHGGGHTWPGGKQYLGERLIGKTSREIVACDVIWDYFKGL